ncbi:MAG: hypothetical protein ABH863_04235 [Candidatus Micrarchaeota archaeon]
MLNEKEGGIKGMLEALLKNSIKIRKPPKSGYQKAALYDFNGTLVSDMKGSGMELYEKRLRQAFGPLMEIEDEKIIQELGKNGIEIGGNIKKGFNLANPLAESIIALIKTPRRGTKAREIYYDFVELAVEREEIGIKPFPDVVAKGNRIDSDRREGLSIISLSRGTDSILKKSIEASGTEKIIDKMYSTIPYGGEKTAECYYKFYHAMLGKGIQITKSYEDEWKNIEGMLICNFALAIKLKLRSLPFKIIWIAREGKRNGPTDELRAFEREFSRLKEKHKWEGNFSSYFGIKSGLA